jgi:head-tail adaptor
MPGAGALNKRLRFEKRPAVADDGYGNVEGEWTAQFTCAARIAPLRGSETVIGQRLAGVQPVIISIRSSGQSRAVEPNWRAVDTRLGTIYNLRAGANFDERNAMIDIIAETGVPV